MKVFFKDDAFAFQFVRNLGFMYYGGSDLGEMMATASQVVEGDFESWFTEWDKRAQRTLARADADIAAGHLVSAKESYLRSSTYFRMAEFYLHGNPQDPRIRSESKASQDAYAKAAQLSGPTWEPVRIPYEGTTLPGYFYKVDDSGKARPTVVFHGGYDSSLEELFFFGAAAAVRRGYNCLTFDGPGQGAPLREEGLPLRYDWEHVVTPVLDYALTRPDVDGNQVVLIGMSLGAFFAARTVAFEERFRAVVLFDGMYDSRQSLLDLLPGDARAALNAGDTARMEQIIHEKMQANTNLRWAVTQGIYACGVASFTDFLEVTKHWTMEGLAERIHCPCLVMEGDEDLSIRGQPQKIYDALRCPKQFARFTAEDGAANHCQSGALAYKDEVIFNWLDETLSASG